jgi:hypothetical protein
MQLVRKFGSRHTLTLGGAHVRIDQPSLRLHELRLASLAFLLISGNSPPLKTFQQLRAFAFEREI